MSVLVRCDGCGALRWSLLQRPGTNAAQECEICGQPLKPERRRPGRRFSKQQRERRDLSPPLERVAPPSGPSAAA